MLVRFLEPASLACLLEPWLRELGFSIFYGSILIKLYHILTEFQTRKAHRVCFRDKDQIVHLLAIVLIVVGYMSAWTALMVDNFLFSQRQSLKQDAHEHQLLAQNARLVSNSRAEPSLFEVDEQRQDEFDWKYSAKVELESDNKSGRNKSASSSETGQLGLTVASLALAPEQLRMMLSKNLNSFSDLFSGLLESKTSYDSSTSSLVHSVRCRKLTWDYVTELSKSRVVVIVVV